MKEREKLRNIRVPDELWDAAMARAAADGRSLSWVIRTFLAEYANLPLTPELRAIREAIELGLAGKMADGVQLLVDRFPELAQQQVPK